MDIVNDSVQLVIAGVAQPARKLTGGTYIIRATATNWNGGSVAIQALDNDGQSFTGVIDDQAAPITFAANGTKKGLVAAGSIVQAAITGAPAGLEVRISRVPF